MRKIKLLLVGKGDSIFFTDYVRALKSCMDVEVDVYSPFADKGNYTTRPFDAIYFDDLEKKRINHIKFISGLIRPLLQRKRFANFLKRNNKFYDIIHFKWILPAWTLNPSEYRKYCTKVFASFWGGELEKQTLLRSHQLYCHTLGLFIEKVDGFINLGNNQIYFKQFPKLRDKMSYGVYGSSIIEKIVSSEIGKNEAKEKMGIPQDSVTIMTGYSGKPMHRHIENIDAICTNPNFIKSKEDICFILPMTRDATEEYIQLIECKLKSYGAKYVLLKGKYLSEDDVVLLRKSTDVILQTSEWDGLSSSIKESLAAGSIAVCGDWLHYELLTEKGFLFLKTRSIEDCAYIVYDILGNRTKYAFFAENNKKIANKEFFWSECIKPWAECYKKALNVMASTRNSKNG